MVRKQDCISILERKVEVLKTMESFEDNDRYYHNCSSIVWFLEDVGVFSSEEAYYWIEKFADVTTDVFMKLCRERGAI